MHDDTAEQKINFLAKQTSRALAHFQDQGDSNKTADNNLLLLPFFMVHVVFACCWYWRRKPYLELFSPWGLNHENVFICLGKYNCDSVFACLSSQSLESPLHFCSQPCIGCLLHWMTPTTQLDSLCSLWNTIIKIRVWPVKAITSSPPLCIAVRTFPDLVVFYDIFIF